MYWLAKISLMCLMCSLSTRWREEVDASMTDAQVCLHTIGDALLPDDKTARFRTRTRKHDGMHHALAWVL